MKDLEEKGEGGRDERVGEGEEEEERRVWSSVKAV